ncbi:hypothetical protein ABZ820_22230 [Streptomyces diacarni]|uniref:hypothetical protein n=1 Tax=Streptomyces diacarni TaxID=2800381 RepID=UPI0033C87F14
MTTSTTTPDHNADLDHDGRTGDGALQRLTGLANSYRERLEAECAKAEAEAERRERKQSVDAACRFIAQHLPATLAQILDTDAWVGYPALREGYAEAEPTAVAHLGSGLWLIFERTKPAGALTLLAPCTCGRYVPNWLGDDYGLAGTLDTLTLSCTGRL